MDHVISWLSVVFILGLKSPFSVNLIIESSRQSLFALPKV